MKKILFLSVFINTIILALFGWAYYTWYIPQSKEAKIKDFYDTENYVHVSPHSIRKDIMQWKQKKILVDLRSNEEYQTSHIVWAINIPAYKNPDESAYDEVSRIVWEFQKLPKDKEVVVYCYSIPCMTGRKIGKMLTENGIYVKHLGIWWNEWRYDWESWNHELEWKNSKVEEYVSSWNEPWTFSGTNTNIFTPCSANENSGC